MRGGIRQLLDDIDAKPLPTSSDRELTEGLALYGIVLPLYVEDFWPLLTVALKQAIDGGRGDAAAVVWPTSTPRAGRTATPTTPSRRSTR